MTTPTRAPWSWLAHPRARLIVIAIGLVLALPTIAIGFLTDDQGFRARLASKSAIAPAAWDLFRFSSGTAEGNRFLVRHGILPWWTSPEFKLHLFRPLTSLLFALDAAVFGSVPLGYHLHSLLWFAVLLVAVGALYRRLLGTESAALALLVFAFSDAHVEAYGWASARHVLVGAVPSVLGLVSAVRAREGWAPGRWLAALAFIVGLAGSEMALGGLVFWFALELLGPIGKDDSRSLSRGAIAAVPPVVLALAYLLLYRALGFGSRGGGGYHDPLAEPLTFASVALTRLPVLLGDAFLGVPAELALRHPGFTLAAIGAVATAFVGVLLWLCWPAIPEQERANLIWLVPGALAATGIGVAGFPTGRVLLLADLGFAALLGVIIRAGFHLAATSRGRGLALTGAVLLAVLHLALAPLHVLLTTRRLVRSARTTERMLQEAEFGEGQAKRIFVMASADPAVFMYARGILASERPGLVRCWSVLSAAATAHRLSRIDDRTLALEPEGRPLLDGPLEVLFRSAERPLAAGDETAQCGARIRVEEVNNGKPTRVTVRFDSPLDAPDLVLLDWRQGQLRRLELPEVGHTIELPWEPRSSRSL